MKTYLIFTDVNSRQYPIPVPADGLSIITQNNVYDVTESSNLEFLIHDDGKILVGGCQVFNLSNLVSIKRETVNE